MMRSMHVWRRRAPMFSMVRFASDATRAISRIAQSVNSSMTFSVAKSARAKLTGRSVLHFYAQPFSGRYLLEACVLHKDDRRVGFFSLGAHVEQHVETHAETLFASCAHMLPQSQVLGGCC